MESFSPEPVFKAPCRTAFWSNLPCPIPAPFSPERIKQSQAPKSPPTCPQPLRGRMDDPQPQSFPTFMLNNQQVPGRDRDIPRNNLGDKATILMAIVR